MALQTSFKEGVEAQLDPRVAESQKVQPNVKVLGTYGSGAYQVEAYDQKTGAKRTIILTTNKISLINPSKEQEQAISTALESGLAHKQVKQTPQGNTYDISFISAPTPTEMALSASLLPELRNLPVQDVKANITTFDRYLPTFSTEKSATSVGYTDIVTKEELIPVASTTKGEFLQPNKSLPTKLEEETRLAIEKGKEKLIEQKAFEPATIILSGLTFENDPAFIKSGIAFFTGTEQEFFDIRRQAARNFLFGSSRDFNVLASAGFTIGTFYVGGLASRAGVIGLASKTIIRGLEALQIASFIEKPNKETAAYALFPVVSEIGGITGLFSKKVKGSFEFFRPVPEAKATYTIQTDLGLFKEGSLTGAKLGKGLGDLSFTIFERPQGAFVLGRGIIDFPLVKKQRISAGDINFRSPSTEGLTLKAIIGNTEYKKDYAEALVNFKKSLIKSDKGLRQGFYESDTGNIYITPTLAGQIKTSQKRTLIHELTHSLDPELKIFQEKLRTGKRQVDPFSQRSQKILNKISIDFLELGKRYYGKREGKSLLKYEIGNIKSFYDPQQYREEMLARFAQTFPTEIIAPTTKTGEYLSGLFYNKYAIVKGNKLYFEVFRPVANARAIIPRGTFQAGKVGNIYQGAVGNLEPIIIETPTRFGRTKQTRISVDIDRSLSVSDETGRAFQISIGRSYEYKKSKVEGEFLAFGKSRETGRKISPSSEKYSYIAQQFQFSRRAGIKGIKSDVSIANIFVRQEKADFKGDNFGNIGNLKTLTEGKPLLEELGLDKAIASVSVAAREKIQNVIKPEISPQVVSSSIKIPKTSDVIGKFTFPSVTTKRPQNAPITVFPSSNIFGVFKQEKESGYANIPSPYFKERKYPKSNPYFKSVRVPDELKISGEKGGILTKQGSTNINKLNIRVKTSEAFGTGTGSVLDTGFLNKELSLTKNIQISGVSQRQKQKTRELFSLRTELAKESIYSPNINLNIFNKPFPIPPFLGLSPSKSKKKKRKGTGKREYEYRPSLSGIYLGRTIKIAPKGLLTGVEIRYPLAQKKKRGVNFI